MGSKLPTCSKKNKSKAQSKSKLAAGGAYVPHLVDSRLTLAPRTRFLLTREVFRQKILPSTQKSKLTLSFIQEGMIAPMLCLRVRLLAQLEVM